MHQRSGIRILIGQAAARPKAESFQTHDRETQQNRPSEEKLRTPDLGQTQDQLQSESGANTQRGKGDRHVFGVQHHPNQRNGHSQGTPYRDPVHDMFMLGIMVRPTADHADATQNK